MRRAGLIYCADCTEPQFKTLRARDQLPFSTDQTDKTRWQEFTLADAFELRLMLDLTEEHGVGIELARYVVTEGVGKLSMHPLNYPSSEGEAWVAAAMVTEPDPKVEEDYWRFAVAGRLGDISGLVADRFDRDFQGSKLVRVVAANASRAANFVRQRASDLGLPEARDFSPVLKNWRWPAWVDQAALASVENDDE